MFSSVCLGTNDPQRGTLLRCGARDTRPPPLRSRARLGGRGLARLGHVRALAHGGSSEGAPGLRPQYTPDFYAAYVRDPDGNKLAAVCRGFTAPPGG